MGQTPPRQRHRSTRRHAGADEINQAVRIRLALPAPFRSGSAGATPQDLQWRLEAGDSFLREVVAQERYFMDKLTAQWVEKAEADYRGMRRPEKAGKGVGILLRS